MALNASRPRSIQMPLATIRAIPSHNMDRHAARANTYASQRDSHTSDLYPLQEHQARKRNATTR
jgi:hypothetical protein